MGSDVHGCAYRSAFKSLRERPISCLSYKGECLVEETCGMERPRTNDKVDSEGGNAILKLDETRYIPTVTTNLLSQERLELDGWVPSFLSTNDGQQRKARSDRSGVRLELEKHGGKKY
ncbi:hypothetical protein BBJ28_00024635 [Nothophytophthora sp. Chile5]|nr:hypothetical protein BBJ28_00024635 [Nothophytophthora sp. Chile5]